MSRATRAHLTAIGPADRVVALAPVTTGVPQLAAAVVTAAVQWATEADALASTMGWAPSTTNALGEATLSLLDAVHTLEASGTAAPSVGDPAG
jgi:hypothetical protein